MAKRRRRREDLTENLEVQLGPDGETVRITGRVTNALVLKEIRRLVEEKGMTQEEAFSHIIKTGAKVMMRNMPFDGQHRAMSDSPESCRQPENPQSSP